MVPQSRDIPDHQRYDGRDGIEVAADTRRHSGHPQQIPRGGGGEETWRRASGKEERQSGISWIGRPLFGGSTRRSCAVGVLFSVRAVRDCEQDTEGGPMSSDKPRADRAVLPLPLLQGFL